jgi:hypothetical protein
VGKSSKKTLYGTNQSGWETSQNHDIYFCHGQDPKDRPWPSGTLLACSCSSCCWGIKRWRKAKTSCHMHNTPRTPNIFTDSGPPIKLPLGGLIRGAPHPPDPPLWGGQNIFWGVITNGPFWPPESNFFVKLLSSNITWAILGESPDPPYPPRTL